MKTARKGGRETKHVAYKRVLDKSPSQDQSTKSVDRKRQQPGLRPANGQPSIASSTEMPQWRISVPHQATTTQQKTVKLPSQLLPYRKTLPVLQTSKKTSASKGHHNHGITRLYKVGSAPSAEKALSLRRCSTCSITVFEQTGTHCGVKPVA